MKIAFMTVRDIYIRCGRRYLAEYTNQDTTIKLKQTRKKT